MFRYFDARAFHLVSLLSFTLILGTVGCGENEVAPIGESCGGHGEFHGDHCDCDPGYTSSEDGLSCEPIESTETDPSDDTESDMSDLVFNPSNGQGSVGQAQDGSQVWLFEAMDGGSILRIELYAGYGAPTAPGIVNLTEAETDYATCGTCIMLRTGCVAHGDHYDCTGTFMPRAEGQVQIDAIGASAGDQLTGELQNIIFQQVSIGQNYATTPVANGDLMRMENWSFDVELDAMDSAR